MTFPDLLFIITRKVWINYNKYSILDEIIERIINLINGTSGPVNQLYVQNKLRNL